MFAPPPTAAAVFGGPHFVPQKNQKTTSGPTIPSALINMPQNKLMTLFIGGIPRSLKDAWLEKILRTCGNVRKLKRARDPHGRYLTFAFVEYVEPEGILRALVVLENLDVLGSKLMIRADDKTREFLNDYESKRTQSDRDSVLDAQARNNVMKVLKDMKNGKDPGQPTFIESEPEFFTQRQTDPDEGLDNLPEEERKLILREIQLFRERAYQKDRERKYREEDIQRKRDRQFQQQKPTSPPPQRKRDNQLDGFIRKHRDSDDSGADISDDEDYSQIKQEKRRKQMLNQYIERERKWMNREKSRLNAIQREEAREKALIERIEQNRKYLYEKLSNFNDLYEIEKQHELYYRDREKWFREREIFRSREIETDNLDRKLEQEEIERNKEWMQKQAQEMASMTPTNSVIQQQPIKLKVFSAQHIAAQAAKRTLGTSSGVIDEDEEERQEEAMRMKRLKAVKEHLDDVLDDDETKLRKRKERIKALVDEIPTNIENLSKWSVQWESLDSNIISRKIRPFVQKKIVEYLGVEEDSLVDYILQQVQAHGVVGDVAIELKEALDEDADEFVIKLWRMIIFESEAKHRGLS